MKQNRVSLPKTQGQLYKMDNDDTNVFATSIIDRYAARPNNLKEMCLASFAMNYDVFIETDDFNLDNDMQKFTNDGIQKSTQNYIKKIYLHKGLGTMRNHKKEAILRTQWYNVISHPEKYYHAKLLLYYPWFDEDELISGFDCYEKSYIVKQEDIVTNANKFNDNCGLFDIPPDDLGSNIPQSVWESTSQMISQEDAVTKKDGFSTLQKLTEEEVNDTDLALDYNMHTHHNQLVKIYSKAANPKEMTFTEYCAFMQSLNSEQWHIVMYNRLWCRNYVHVSWQNKQIEGYWIFLSGPGGTGKSHVLKMIQRDMRYFVQNVTNCDPDQPTVLMTAPTGSAAYQIRGSTIDSTFYFMTKVKTNLAGRRGLLCRLTSRMLCLSQLMKSIW